MKIRSTLLAVSAIFAFVTEASADTLPASILSGYFCAGVFQYCSSNALVYPQNTSASYTSDPNSPPGSAFATGDGMFSPSPNVSASATASGNASGYAYMAITYSIELTGPSGLVPITINTSGVAGLNSEIITSIFNPSTSAFSYLAFASYGSISVYDTNGGYLVPFGPGSSYDRSDTVNLMEGVIYTVGLVAIASANSTFPQQSAAVDPYFSDIPAGYELDISSGVGNSPLSATPLPATLPLLATSLGALGLLGWRRKRRAAAIAA